MYTKSQRQQNIFFWEENWKFLIVTFIILSSSLKFKFVFITGQVKFWGPIPSPAISAGQRLELKSSITLAGLSLKERLFPQKRGNGHDYIDLAALINRQGTGILQQLELVEDEIIKRAKPLIHQMHRNGQSFEAWDSFYQWVDGIVRSEYQTRLGVLIP